MIRIKHFLWLLIAILILQPVIADINIVSDDSDVEIINMQLAGFSHHTNIIQSAFDVLGHENTNLDQANYSVAMDHSAKVESQACCDDYHTSLGHCTMSCCFIPSNLIHISVLAHHGEPTEILLLWSTQYPLVENRPPIA